MDGTDARAGGIAGVQVKPLRWIGDERGRLLETLRRDDAMYAGFGQIYYSWCFPGVVKGFHRHRAQDDYFCALVGQVKLVLIDDRAGSPTQGVTLEVHLGEHDPKLVFIPRGVLHGFSCVSETAALVANAVTEPYDPAAPDDERVDPHARHDWRRRDR